jgi:hypothetical protein
MRGSPHRRHRQTRVVNSVTINLQGAHDFIWTGLVSRTMTVFASILNRQESRLNSSSAHPVGAHAKRRNATFLGPIRRGGTTTAIPNSRNKKAYVAALATMPASTRMLTP